MDASPSRAGSKIDNIRSRVNVAVTQLTSAHQVIDRLESQISHQSHQIDHLHQLQNKALRQLDLQKSELDIYYISMSKMQERHRQANHVISTLQEHFVASNDLIEALKNDMVGVNNTLHDQVEALGKANEKTLALELQVSHMRACLMECTKDVPESLKDTMRTAHPSRAEKLGPELAPKFARSTITNGKENLRRPKGRQDVDDSFVRFLKQRLDNTAFTDRSNNENLNTIHYQSSGQDDNFVGCSGDWRRTASKAKVTLNPTSAPFTPSDSATKNTNSLQPIGALHRPTMTDSPQAKPVPAIKPHSMSSYSIPPHLRGLTQPNPKAPALERPERATSNPLQQITNGVKPFQVPTLVPDRTTAPPHEDNPSQDPATPPPRPKSPKARNHNQPSPPHQRPPALGNLIDFNTDTSPTPPAHSNPAAFVQQYNTLLADFKTKWSAAPPSSNPESEAPQGEHHDDEKPNDTLPRTTQSPTQLNGKEQEEEEEEVHNDNDNTNKPPSPQPTKKTNPHPPSSKPSPRPTGSHVLGEAMDPATRALVLMPQPRRGDKWVELDLGWRAVERGGGRVVYVL